MTDTGLTWPWIFGLFALYIFATALAQAAIPDLRRWIQRKREKK